MNKFLLIKLELILMLSLAYCGSTELRGLLSSEEQIAIILILK